MFHNLCNIIWVLYKNQNLNKGSNSYKKATAKTKPTRTKRNKKTMHKKLIKK